jgi:hypothetical protein
MTRTADEVREADGIVYSQCPFCSQDTRLHTESIRLGAEILCSECSAILRIESTNPLALMEVEEKDLL